MFSFVSDDYLLEAKLKRREVLSGLRKAQVQRSRSQDVFLRQTLCWTHGHSPARWASSPPGILNIKRAMLWRGFNRRRLFVDRTPWKEATLNVFTWKPPVGRLREKQKPLILTQGGKKTAQSIRFTRLPPPTSFEINLKSSHCILNSSHQSRNGRSPVL